MNLLINYVYEFGSGRGKFRKSPVISSYDTAFCELSIAVMVSLLSKSHSCSLSLAAIRSLPIHHSRTMTEPVHRDAVVVLVTPPASQWFSCCHL